MFVGQSSSGMSVRSITFDNHSNASCSKAKIRLAVQCFYKGSGLHTNCSARLPVPRTQQVVRLGRTSGMREKARMSGMREKARCPPTARIEDAPSGIDSDRTTLTPSTSPPTVPTCCNGWKEAWARAFSQGIGARV